MLASVPTLVKAPIHNNRLILARALALVETPHPIQSLLTLVHAPRRLDAPIGGHVQEVGLVALAKGVELFVVPEQRRVGRVGALCVRTWVECMRRAGR